MPSMEHLTHRWKRKGKSAATDSMEQITVEQPNSWGLVNLEVQRTINRP